MTGPGSSPSSMTRATISIWRRSPGVDTTIRRSGGGGSNFFRRTARGIETPAETLGLGSGSCRDLAVLMIEAARSLGLAARFVSGYLHVAPDADPAGADRLGGGATHAWVQVNLPGAGWIDYDP